MKGRGKNYSVLAKVYALRQDGDCWIRIEMTPVQGEKMYEMRLDIKQVSGLHSQKGLVLYLILCCHHLEILNF